MAKKIKFGNSYKSKPVTFKYKHEDIEYTITISAVIVIDSHFGADADGNRGVCAEFIDDYCDAIYRSSNSKGHFISPKSIPLEAENKLNEMIDEYEGWECAESDSPEEDDYDY